MHEDVRDALIKARQAEEYAEKLRNDVWDVIHDEYDAEFVQSLIDFDGMSIEEYMRGVMSVGGMVIDAPGSPSLDEVIELFDDE